MLETFAEYETPATVHAAKRVPTKTESCLINYPSYKRYHLKVDDLDSLLTKVFLGHANPLITPLYNDWADPCLMDRPESLDEYLKIARKHRVNTLARFARVFGKK